MLYQLVQAELQTIALANSRPDYVFFVVDPALIPDEPDSPNRMLIFFLALIAIITTLLLLIPAILAVKK